MCRMDLLLSTVVHGRWTLDYVYKVEDNESRKELYKYSSRRGARANGGCERDSPIVQMDRSRVFLFRFRGKNSLVGRGEPA